MNTTDILMGIVATEAFEAQPLHEPKAPMTEGELWSWVRSVMSQGADIRCDYDSGKYQSYEAYSARLDVAANERAQELAARLMPPNAPLEPPAEGRSASKRPLGGG